MSGPIVGLIQEENVSDDVRQPYRAIKAQF